jgi:hypothetical protein
MVQWSPDGHHLAMLTLVDETWHLATIPMSDGGASGPLALGPVHEGPFAWSPDATLLAFVTTIRRYDHSQPGITSIQVVDPAFRGPPVTILQRDRTITCLSWQWLAP